MDFYSLCKANKNSSRILLTAVNILIFKRFVYEIRNDKEMEIYLKQTGRIGAPNIRPSSLNPLWSGKNVKADAIIGATPNELDQ